MIELNHPIISGDFSVLSSLSSGYKLYFDRKTGAKIGEGFDYSGSVLKDERMRFLKAVIYFDLGDYESRTFIPNPWYSSDA